MSKGFMTARLGAATLAAAMTGAVIAAAVECVPAKAADDISSKVQICAACHGGNGVPTNNITPIIWGQDANYLYKELHDYHSGERSNPIMEPMARNFTLEELRQMADYFAAKTWPAPSAAEPAAAAPASAVMCEACHQKTFEGGAPAPRLAGLSTDYLTAAMRNFADGKRTNNLDMPGFMRALSASDRQAIAHYISGL